MRRACAVSGGIVILILAQFAVAVGLVFLIEKPVPIVGWSALVLWLILTLLGAKLFLKGWRP